MEEIIEKKWFLYKKDWTVLENDELRNEVTVNTVRVIIGIFLIAGYAAKISEHKTIGIIATFSSILMIAVSGYIFRYYLKKGFFHPYLKYIMLSIDSIALFVVLYCYMYSVAGEIAVKNPIMHSLYFMIMMYSAMRKNPKFAILCGGSMIAVKIAIFIISIAAGYLELGSGDIMDPYKIGYTTISQQVTETVFIAGFMVIIYFLIKNKRILVGQLVQTTDELVEEHKKTQQIVDLQKLIENMESMANALMKSSKELSDDSNAFIMLSDRQQQSTKTVQDSTDRMVNKNANLEKEINQQLESIEKSIDDISMMLARFEQVRLHNQQMKDEAESIKDFISKSQENMGAFQKQIDNLMQGIQTISSSLGNIRNIADKTNVLAINASIESARAGQQGKGFGVVAKEVRNLSMMSHKFTGEIDDLINENRENIENTHNQLEITLKTLSEMNDRVLGLITSVDGSVKNYKYFSNFSENFMKAAKDVSTIFNQIKGNIADQLSSINDITQQVNQVSNISEEVHERAISLNSSSNRMLDKANSFKELQYSHEITEKNLGDSTTK